MGGCGYRWEGRAGIRVDHGEGGCRWELGVKKREGREGRKGKKEGNPAYFINVYKTSSCIFCKNKFLSNISVCSGFPAW